MGYIGTLPATSFESVQKDRFTSTTGTTVTLTQDVGSLQDIIVWVNAVKQDYSNYSVGGSGNRTLTLGGTLVSTDVVEVCYIGKTFQTVSPGDNTITTAMLQDSAITSAKIGVDVIVAEDLAANAITVSELADNAVTTAKINADAVTAAKIADDVVDSEHLAAGAIDTEHIAALQVTTAKIAADAITAGQLADDVVDSDHLAAGGIDTEHLGNLQVTTAKIAADAIDGTKLADNAVDSEHYTDGSIDTAHIDNLQVTTAKIAADAIDGTKLADDAVESEHMAAGSVDNAHLAGSIATSKIGSGTFADARISQSSVTQHAVTFDDTDLRSDIMTLALKEAITENRVAYNLPNAMIEQFQDDSKIGTETDGDRNASEYWGTVSAGDMDGYTKLLCHFNGNLTDEVGTHTLTAVSGAVTSTAEKKFGTHSLRTTSADYVTMPDHADWDWDTNDFTIESWAKNDSGAFTAMETPIWSQSQGGNPGSNNNIWVQITHTTGGIYVHGNTGSGETNVTGTWPSVGTDWHHYCIQKHDTNNLSFYIDGVREATASSSAYAELGGGSTLVASIGARYNGATAWQGYIDEVRVSVGIARYTTTGFTSPTTAFASTTANATGTLISTANTANAAQTKVSGVILYKNNEGTATLGTDLKIYFTCDGGSNWTESTPTAAGTFSSGILMAKCPEVTCTSGTDIRYKAVWANQVASSKETQLHGIGMNY